MRASRWPRLQDERRLDFMPFDLAHSGHLGPTRLCSHVLRPELHAVRAMDDEDRRFNRHYLRRWGLPNPARDALNAVALRMPQASLILSAASAAGVEPVLVELRQLGILGSLGLLEVGGGLLLHQATKRCLFGAVASVVDQRTISGARWGAGRWLARAASEVMASDGSARPAVVFDGHLPRESVDLAVASMWLGDLLLHRRSTRHLRVAEHSGVACPYPDSLRARGLLGPTGRAALPDQALETGGPDRRDRAGCAGAEVDHRAGRASGCGDAAARA